MLLTAERAGIVEFNLGVQRLVAGRIANGALIFRDFKIGTFKCHISLRADKNEFHAWGEAFFRYFGKQSEAAASAWHRFWYPF
jgi:hypothetical protein